MRLVTLAAFAIVLVVSATIGRDTRFNGDDATTATKIGDTTALGDGLICQRFENTIFCDYP